MLVFVLLVLATLAAVPVPLNRQIRELRVELEAAEPARTLVTSLQASLVQQMAALSELLLTGDTTAAEDHAEAVAREESIYRDLQPLVQRLGRDVLAGYVEVRLQAGLWRERTVGLDELLESPPTPGQPRPRRERALFDQVVDATTALDAAILRHGDAIRARISAAERLRLNVTFALGLLALFAGAAAALLAGRARRFAAESERRRAEAEAALEELARETEVRERLLRGITHDVKNPLGAAKGYAQLLAIGAKAPIHPEQAPLVAGVLRSVDSALDIVTDLLEVARAEGGRLSVERVETDLGAVVEETVEDLRPEAERAGHTLEYRHADGPLRVYTDRARVRQVLQNLVSNAVKYTPPPGRVVVTTELLEHAGGGDGRVWAAVRVSDTGPGIPLQFREQIFEEFTRLEDRPDVPGHGLGLAIARRIARLLGGDVALEDSEGSGATFVLRLPIRHPTSEARGDSPVEDAVTQGKGFS